MVIDEVLEDFDDFEGFEEAPLFDSVEALGGDMVGQRFAVGDGFELPPQPQLAEGVVTGAEVFGLLRGEHPQLPQLGDLRLGAAADQAGGEDGKSTDPVEGEGEGEVEAGQGMVAVEQHRIVFNLTHPHLQSCAILQLQFEGSPTRSPRPGGNWLRGRRSRLSACRSP